MAMVKWIPYHYLFIYSWWGCDLGQPYKYGLSFIPL